jgi:hypothetical protein
MSRSVKRHAVIDGASSVGLSRRIGVVCTTSFWARAAPL